MQRDRSIKLNASPVPCVFQSRITAMPPETKSARIIILFNDGDTLAQAVFLSGLFEAKALCSGLGACGLCAIRVTSKPPAPVSKEKLFFNEQELEAGWRLGCCHRAQDGMEAEVPATLRQREDKGGALEDRIAIKRTFKKAPFIETGIEAGSEAGVAGSIKTGTAPGLAKAGGSLGIDLGTTSIAWSWVDSCGDILAKGGTLNPQLGAGSEVMSRLSYAGTDGGLERLRSLVVSPLAEIAGKTVGQSGSGCRICLAGNPAMTSIFLGIKPHALSAAPYKLPFEGGKTYEVEGLGSVYIPPQLAPFVGGDISAGYAAVVFGSSAPPRYPFLLADMGTNGEFLLALSPDKALCASVALGPALEGIGLAFGVESGPGAITSFSLGPQGLQAHFYEPGHSVGSENAGQNMPIAQGISGTGYLSLLHILLQQGILSRDGRFIAADATRILRLPPPSHPSELSGRLPLPHGFHLFAADVEELLKVKAAFSLGLKRLLSRAGLPARELAKIFLAGAFGEHVPLDALDNAGFFPPGITSKIKTVGNASLSGACLLARDETIRDRLQAWAAHVNPVDLASDECFLRNYISEMHFSW